MCFGSDTDGHTATEKYIQTYLPVLALFIKNPMLIDINMSFWYYRLEAYVPNILKVINEQMFGNILSGRFSACRNRKTGLRDRISCSIGLYSKHFYPR